MRIKLKVEKIQRMLLPWRKNLEKDSLFETSRDKTSRASTLIYADCPCHCFAQVFWYLNKSDLLIFDVEKIKSIGLLDHEQNFTLFLVGFMLGSRRIESKVLNYRECKSVIEEIVYSRRLELVETFCEALAIPVEVKRICCLNQFCSWFRATLTSWLYKLAINH